MPKKQEAKRPKGRKIGRTQRKIMGRGKPLALFVRNKISAAEYFRLTNQPHKG